MPSPRLTIWKIVKACRAVCAILGLKPASAQAAMKLSKSAGAYSRENATNA
ncbi:hypothetical protein D3C73_1664580 [compost metagenome]